MKPKLILPIALLAAAAIAAGALLWRKASQNSALIAQAAPEIPASLAPPELLKRIQDATTKSKSGPAPLAGLAELSRLYHANDYTREAWQCYATLVLVEPSEPRWPYRFARILAGYGQLEEATPLYAKAAELDPSYPPAHIRLGDTLLKQNRFTEAQAAYADALDLDPANAYAHVGQARVAIAAEDWTTARSHLEQAVKATNYQIGADLLGDVYEKLGLPNQETQVLQYLASGSYADIPDPWSLALMDDCYDAYQVSIAGGWVAHQGDVATGLRYIRRAVELDPDTSTLHYQLAGIYLRLDDTEKAETHFRRCVELQPDFADAWLALIDLAKRRKSPTLARRTLDQALQVAPDSPSLNIERGRQLLAQKQFSQAIPYFKRGIELRPHEAVGYIALAQAYITQNRTEEGVQQMREALVREPNHPVAISTLAFDAIVNRRQADADQWLAKVRQQSRIAADEIAQLEAMYQKAFAKQ